MNRITLLAVLLLGLAGTAQADVVAMDAYVRGLPPGSTTTAAYLTLRNEGAEDVALVAASSPVAGSVMLHETMNHDGMLHMMHVEQVLIPAGGEITLASGGLHLMLMQLQQMPADGSVVELQLRFSDGSTVQVAAPVRSVLDE